jgi:hypothetical protein
LVWTGVNGHNVDTEHNNHLCCGCEQKKFSPNVPLVYSATTKIHAIVKKKFLINMEDNDDWLASNKTWKKWTRIGDGELLSYDGIKFHTPIDEERLVREMKIRKKLDDRKLDNNRK